MLISYCILCNFGVVNRITLGSIINYYEDAKDRKHCQLNLNRLIGVDGGGRLGGSARIPRYIKNKIHARDLITTT